MVIIIIIILKVNYKSKSGASFWRRGGERKRKIGELQ